MHQDFVYLDEYGLRGQNFYAANAQRYGISKEELKAIGILDERAQVHKKIIPALQKIDTQLRQRGYGLLVTDAYRSPELYKLAYKKRVAKYGEEITNKLMNMDDMPHATGLTVDVGLFDPKTNQEIPTRSREDGPESLMFDFYRNKTDEKSKNFQKLQDLLKKVMLENGFEVGVKNEYFHFNYAK